MLDRRGVRRRHKARIDIAETAIAGNHMRGAFLDTAEFTIPHHVAGAEILHRAPRRIAEAAGVARGRTKANRCRNSGGRQCRSEADCHGAKIVMAPSLSRRDVDARPPNAAACWVIPPGPSDAKWRPRASAIRPPFPAKWYEHLDQLPQSPGTYNARRNARIVCAFHSSKLP